MIIFGFAAIPLFGMVGAAVDYSQAANLRTKLQVATDATTLLVAREADTLNDTELLARAKKVLAGRDRRTSPPQARLPDARAPAAPSSP